MSVSLESYLVYQGDEYIILNKPGGLLSQAGQNKKEAGLVDLVNEETGKNYHLLTRLDRPVSGLSVLSDNKQFIKSYLSAQSQSLIRKSYLALVEGQWTISDETFLHHAIHDKRRHKSIIVKEQTHNSRQLNCSVNTLLLLDNYTLVEVKITSGRFHQIRSQLAHLEHPVKGDLKYGARRRNKEPYIFLHSYSIEMLHRGCDQNIHKAGLSKNVDLWKLVAEKLNLTLHG